MKRALEARDAIVEALVEAEALRLEKRDDIATVILNTLTKYNLTVQRKRVRRSEPDEMTIPTGTPRRLPR